MKYLVKFNVDKETTTGNLDYTMKQLSDEKYHSFETKEIKQYGETLILVSYKETRISEVNADTKAEAEKKATKLESATIGLNPVVLSVKAIEEEKEEGKNTYKVSLFSMFQGKTYEEIIKADSEEEALEKANPDEDCKVQLVEEGTKAVEHIIDDEELLFDMDMNNVDGIETVEGMGGKERSSYTREQIEASVFADNLSQDEKIMKSQETIGLNKTQTSKALGVDVGTYGKWSRGAQSAPAVAMSHIECLRFLKEYDLLDDWIAQRAG